MLRFIDLFAGIGGIRCGLEQAAHELGIDTQCVFSSEIKPAAINILGQNHPREMITGDITAVDAKTIPDFDILCAGFPCQAFSMAGARRGFADTRGTLFFDVARILKEKKPLGFILENVEGLVNHDDGKTLEVILNTLTKDLHYKVNYRILDATDFGVPQQRRRIYITGTKKRVVNMDKFPVEHRPLNAILEHGLHVSDSVFINRLLELYTPQQLQGKSIKDKRGGMDNIHSWDLQLKGAVSAEEKDLLNLMMTKRRMHKWADEWGIKWMDGMPLTTKMIRTFYDKSELPQMLKDLTKKDYLRFEHPKQQVEKDGVKIRVPDTSKPKGYNIVAGKLSFEVSEILDPNGYAPTMVATDMAHIFVVDGNGLRNLSLREGLGLFGYPDDFNFEINDKDGFDLLGNTVVVPVIQAVSTRLLNALIISHQWSK